MSHLAARPISAPQAAAAFNSLANRFLIPLLNSRAGARLGRRLAVVEYLGRRTGQHHQLVAIYVTEGQSVSITVGMAEHKTWWRNFATPRALRLRLAGVSHDALAHVVRDGEHVRVVAELVPPLPAAPSLDPRR